MHSEIQPTDPTVRRGPTVRRVYMHTALLPDPAHSPARIDHLGATATLITGHTGTLLADLVPHVLAQLDDDQLRLWLDAYGVTHVSTGHVRTEWASALHGLLWVPVCRATLPQRIRWR